MCIFANSFEIVGDIGVAIAFAAACAFWVLGVVAQVNATKNRRTGVCSSAAWNWPLTIAFRRDVHVDDMFTDIGKWWLKAGVCAVLGFVLSVVAIVAIGQMK